MQCCPYVLLFFFLKNPATTEIHTLSLHDALPIFDDIAEEVVALGQLLAAVVDADEELRSVRVGPGTKDRKSTRLNSSHRCISYAVFCLKKKKGPLEGVDHVPLTGDQRPVGVEEHV